jgi:hypothetical protein
MAVAAAGNGTQTAVIGTEHTLLDTSAGGVYTFEVDPAAMAAGDSLELRIYKMVLTAGTRRCCYYARYDGVQVADDMLKVSVPVATELTDSGAIRFTLKQIAGTGRAFPWKVLSY